MTIDNPKKLKGDIATKYGNNSFDLNCLLLLKK